MLSRKNFFTFFFLFCVGLVFPTISYAADICEGYDTTNDPQKTTVLRGICYYATNKSYTTDFNKIDCSIAFTTCAKLPTCAEMTANDYHKDANYIGISDERRNCGWAAGTEIKCCASKNQSQSQAAPPPPCITGPSGFCNQVDTGLGTIQVQPGAIVGSILSLLLGISGGVAVILIMFAGYRIIFSNADEERMKGAREMLTSAIVGLLFIIFSVIILRVIGVDILHLPGIK